MALEGPYVGPRPFERNEGSLFFGRERESEDLLSLIIAHPVVLLYAQSGAGKTSILNASLIPRLESEELEVLPMARVRGVIPPGLKSQSIRNLYTFNAITSWEAALADTHHASQSLDEYLRSRKHRVDESGAALPRVIIFDQLEELFILYSDRKEEREAFLRQVAKALIYDRLLRVLLVLREDFIAEMDSYAPLLPEKLRSRYRLERLGQSAAFAAITGPLNGTGRRFAEGAAAKIVEDLLKVRVETSTGEIQEIVGESVEPVQLQVVCQMLWRELPNDITEITTDHLRGFADADRALRMFYEDVIRRTVEETKVNEKALREWCGSLLITSSSTRGMVHRGQKDTAGISNEVVDLLENRHLIRSEWRAGARWYELTHDRFIEPIKESNACWHDEGQEKAEKVIALLLRAYDLFPRHGLQADEVVRRDLEEALSISTIIGDQPGQARALSLLGDLCRRDKIYEEALDKYRAALLIAQSTEDHSLTVRLLTGISGLLFQLGRYEESAEVCTSLIALLPDEPLGYDWRGSALWYGGRLEEAMRDYTKEVALAPGLFNAYSCRGQILAELGNYTDALHDLDHAIEIEPTYGSGAAYAHNGRGLAYAGLGQYRRALQEFALSIQKAPNNAWVFFNRAWAFEWRGNSTRAIKDLRKSLALTDPPLTTLKRQQAEARLNNLLGKTTLENTTHGL